MAIYLDRSLKFNGFQWNILSEKLTRFDEILKISHQFYYDGHSPNSEHEIMQTGNLC